MFVHTLFFSSSLSFVNHRHGRNAMHPLALYTPGTQYCDYIVGVVHFIILDSNIASSTKQFEWFQHVIQSNRNKKAMFTVVVVHIAPFVEYWEPNAWKKRGEKHWGEDIRYLYVPLFDKYSVDLVLSGHSHIYQRGNNAPQADGSLSVDEKTGKKTVPLFSKRTKEQESIQSTTYVIGGGGGAELEIEGINHVENYDFYQVTKFQVHYLQIDVVGCSVKKKEKEESCRMEVQATNPLTEMMIDQFTLYAHDRASGTEH